MNGGIIFNSPLLSYRRFFSLAVLSSICIYIGFVFNIVLLYVILSRIFLDDEKRGRKRETPKLSKRRNSRGKVEDENYPLEKNKNKTVGIGANTGAIYAPVRKFQHQCLYSTGVCTHPTGIIFIFLSITWMKVIVYIYFTIIVNNTQKGYVNTLLRACLIP